jgi:hypothetical protein
MKISLLALLLFVSALKAQQRSTGDASSHGNCSPAISGNTNTITLDCTDKHTQQAIFNLLKTIHDSQLPTEQILEKLDEILKTMDAIRPRRLTTDQKKQLTNILHPLAGYTADVLCDPVGDACGLSDDLVAVLNNAGWVRLRPSVPPGGEPTLDPSGLSKEVFSYRSANLAECRGIQILVLPSVVHSAESAPPFNAFVAALVAMKLMTAQPRVHWNDYVDSVPRITIDVCRKE